MDLEQATLHDGRNILFQPQVIGEGGMKQVFFNADRSAVLCFYKDQNTKTDPHRLDRLQAILQEYNPTLDQATGEYWKDLFCWPSAIIRKPRLGIVTPAYPANYYFSAGPYQGREKEGKWFTVPKYRERLPRSELGHWKNHLLFCLQLTRAVGRLHLAGLAHSDLSSKNVLVDPSHGQSVVIDIDSLVVPGIFPPEVLGTQGYIAPEVLATRHLPYRDSERKIPSINTDLHALAVLIYEYLLFRHPLKTPAALGGKESQGSKALTLGEQAVFVENGPLSQNYPIESTVPGAALGPELEKLFAQAFVQGLQNPTRRPGAIEWQRGLFKTLNLVYPCSNPACSAGWFVFCDFNAANSCCPFCREPLSGPPKIPLLKLRSQRRPGQWFQDEELVVYDKLYLQKWHVFDDQNPGPGNDSTPQAYFVFYEGRWLLVNLALTSLTTPSGNRVLPGQAVELTPGTGLWLSQAPNGRFAEVVMHSLD